MPRQTADAWDSIRAEREAGASFGDLASRYDVSKPAIVRRAKAEKWGDGSDLGDAVRRKVTEKVTGIVTTANAKKKAEAMDAEAEKVAEVARRHRKEWEQVVMLRQEALAARKVDQKDAFEKAKLAKITAEMTAIQQAGERKAWGLDVQSEAEIIITNKRSFAHD